MNKELEALKRLLPYLPEGDMLEDEVRILSIALERKDKLETENEKLKVRNKNLKKAFVALSKEDEKTKKLLSIEIEKNRAFEIIKEKELLSVYRDNNGKYFFIFTGKYGFEHNTAVEISQEEFDSVKGVIKK